MTRTMIRRLAARLTIVLVTVTCSAAAQRPAASPVGRASAADAVLERGEKQFKAADYAGALATFSADGTPADPRILRYVALCEDRLGNYEKAVRAYERFVAAAPASMRTETKDA